MPGIQVIERFRTPLIVVEILSVALFAGQLLYLRNVGTFSPSPLANVAMLLPPLLATACFFPLCYLAWFRQHVTSPFRSLRLVFFWLLAAVAGLIWFGILKASLAVLFQ